MSGLTKFIQTKIDLLYRLRKTLPQSILDLFDSIKSKIGFDSLERKFWNNNYG